MEIFHLAGELHFTLECYFFTDQQHQSMAVNKDKVLFIGISFLKAKESIAEAIGRGSRSS
jgi:hypothetical protein